MSARIFALLAVFFFALTFPALAEGRRIALVVGNSAYNSLPTLPNASGDARSMAAALIARHFEVTLLVNADLSDLLAAVHRIVGTEDPRPETVLFYFAGHGFQLDGTNYLVPVDAALDSRTHIDRDTVRLDDLISQLDAPEHQTIVLIDACRDNPLPESITGQSPGLAVVNTGVNTYTAFATSPGGFSSDGNGWHSPFTGALLQHIALPDLPISTMMIKVRAAVLKETNGLQDPWDNNSLRSDFYFNEGDYAAGVDLGAPPNPSDEASGSPPATEVASVDGAHKREAIPNPWPSVFRLPFPANSLAPAGSTTGTQVPEMANPPKSAAPVTVASTDEHETINSSAPEPQLNLPPLVPPGSTTTMPPTAPDVVQPSAPAADPITGSLEASIQKELKRLGCYADALDGKWGPASRKALRRFAKAASTRPPQEPNQLLLTILQRTGPAVCSQRPPAEAVAPDTEAPPKKHGKGKGPATEEANVPLKVPTPPKPSKGGPRVSVATVARNRPGQASPAVGNLAAGQPISVDLCDRLWCRVSWSGGKGWIDKRVIAGM